jgi:ornithine carbamoyltransferase
VSKHLFRLRDLGHAGIWSILHSAGNQASEPAQAILQGANVPLLLAEHAPEDRLILTLAVRGMGGSEVCFGPGEWPGEACARTAQGFTFDLAGPLCVVGGLDLPTLELFAAGACTLTNGGGPDAHPCRLLADLALMHTRRPDLSATRIAWVGGADGLAHSLIEAAMYLPFELFMALPEGGEPDRELLSLALAAGAKIFLTRDLPAAVEGAHYVYAGRGPYSEKGGELRAGMLIDGELMKLASPEAQVLVGHETGRQVRVEVPDVCAVPARERFAVHLRVQRLIWTRLLRNSRSQ